MKRYLPLLMISGLLFQSCSNSFVSVSKRQYRNGYYIHFTGRADGKSKISENQHSVEENVIEKNNPCCDEVAEESKADSSENTPINKSYASDPLKETTPSKINKQLKEISGTIINSVSKPVIKRNTTSIDAHSSTHGLIKNLVWFIIVLLLLTYIVAIATGGFGLGIAVHLFLLAALVLLFLKLISPL